MATLLYKDQEINQRDTDGWVNLTQMAKANNARLDKWQESPETQKYLKALQESISPDLGVSVLEVKATGFPAVKTTWGHPLVALHFAQWISPEFHLWCNQHIRTLMETGETKLIPEQIPVNQLPSYVVAQETAKAIDVIQEKLALTQPRLAQFLIEAAMNDIKRMVALPPATLVEDQLMTCEAWGNENGYPVTKNNRVQLGKFVAKQWRAEMGSEPMTQKQECGGALRDIKVYPVSFLEQVVPLFFS